MTLDKPLCIPLYNLRFQWPIEITQSGDSTRILKMTADFLIASNFQYRQHRILLYINISVVEQSTNLNAK